MQKKILEILVQAALLVVCGPIYDNPPNPHYFFSNCAKFEQGWTNFILVILLGPAFEFLLNNGSKKLVNATSDL